MIVANDALGGMIVANDVDKSRCYMLIHQILKRMKNALTVVLCEDATCLPDMYIAVGNHLSLKHQICSASSA